MAKKQNSRQVALKLLNVTLTVGVVYFCYVYGAHLFATADFSSLKDRWWALVVAGCLFLAYYALGALHWLWVCRIVNPNTKGSQSVAYAASQPYKYLPTGVFSVSYRAVYAKQLGLTIKESTYAQLIENFNIVGSGIGVALLFYAWHIGWVYGLLLELLFAVILCASVYYKLKITIPFMKKRYKIHTYKIVWSFLLMALAWFVAGASFWLTGYSTGVFLNLLLAISANAAGFVVSILAIFAPGGIGVRELTLTMFGIQNSTVVLWRLLTFIVDILVGGIVVVLLKMNKIR